MGLQQVLIQNSKEAWVASLGVPIGITQTIGIKPTCVAKRRILGLAIIKVRKIEQTVLNEEDRDRQSTSVWKNLSVLVPGSVAQPEKK